MNKVIRMVDPTATESTCIEQATELLRSMIQMKFRKVVTTKNHFLSDPFQQLKQKHPFKDEVPKEMFHGTKSEEIAHNITDRGLVCDSTIGVHQHNVGVYVTPDLRTAFKYCDELLQSSNYVLPVLPMMHVRVVTGHVDGAPWNIGVEKQAKFADGVFTTGNKTQDPTIFCCKFVYQVDVIGYFVLESCGLGYLDMDVLNRRGAGFSNVSLNRESWMWIRMSVEERKAAADKVVAMSVVNADAAVGGAAGAGIPRVRIYNPNIEMLRIVVPPPSMQTPTIVRTFPFQAPPAATGKGKQSRDDCDCVMEGCDRTSWNGAAQQACCKSCVPSKGKTHGWNCEALYRAMENSRAFMTKRQKDGGAGGAGGA
jgi:hypothetical protein